MGSEAKAMIEIIDMHDATPEERKELEEEAQEEINRPAQAY